MPQIRTVGELARCALRIGRHCDLLSSKRPLSAHRAERRCAKMFCKRVGFYPFRGPDASLALGNRSTRPVNECRFRILLIRAAGLPGCQKYDTGNDLSGALGTLKAFPRRWME